MSGQGTDTFSRAHHEVRHGHGFLEAWLNRLQSDIRTPYRRGDQLRRKRTFLQLETLEDRTMPSTIARWNFENLPIAVNNGPAPSTGTGTASGLGMTNSFKTTSGSGGTGSVNTDDVLLGASGDTGSDGHADLTQAWRIRGLNPGNGWTSQAAIGTQGAEFAEHRGVHLHQRELRLVRDNSG